MFLASHVRISNIFLFLQNIFQRQIYISFRKVALSSFKLTFHLNLELHITSEWTTDRLLPSVKPEFFMFCVNEASENWTQFKGMQRQFPDFAKCI